MTDKLKNTSIVGAIFLMATSAIGPGFLTQTAVFTERLMASFAFVILVSILIDIGAQLNIWQIISGHGRRAQEITNELMPGSGYLLTALIVFGGFAFNIGNLSGTGLGLNALTGMKVEYGAIVSTLLLTAIFVRKSFKSMMDRFTQIMGLLMISLTMYVMLKGNPPYLLAFKESIFPSQLDWMAIVTLVGGTVGGYISFAGAHRLLDSGMKGKKYTEEVRKASIQAILLASVMRVLLFLAALGVLAQGASLDPKNPPSSIFSIGAGQVGQYLFGLVMWAAALTSVIGSAFTSISFLKTWHPSIQKHESKWILGFIYISLFILVLIGKPVRLLVWAGTINGFILPIALALLLLTVKKLAAEKIHIPLWQQFFGWAIVAVMTWMSLQVML